jgi:hypothetical protein
MTLETKDKITFVCLVVAVVMFTRCQHEEARKAMLKDWGWYNRPLSQEEQDQVDRALRDDEDENAQRN